MNPTIIVLYAFSATLGEDVDLVDIALAPDTIDRHSLPQKYCFAGASVLLVRALDRLFPCAGSCDIEDTYATEDVDASQDLLVDIFECIEKLL